jgi:neuronal guanine nucleotide exchange factor
VFYIGKWLLFNTLFCVTDCPQVQAIHQYKAQQPDELNLEESDVINVFKKMIDGMSLILQ